MNLTIEVTWADGRVTQHQMNGLPRLPYDQLREELNADLASYLDPDELPLSPEGWALNWTAVRLVRGRDERVRGFIPAAALGDAAAVIGFSPAEISEPVAAAVRDHRARPTRYERDLNIPAGSAFSHERGSHWRPDQMCADQWQQLQTIRAHDRARRRRQRERVAS